MCNCHESVEGSGNTVVRVPTQSWGGGCEGRLSKEKIDLESSWNDRGPSDKVVVGKAGEERTF